MCMCVFVLHVHIHICVYVCVCMHACMYVYVCNVCTYICMNVWPYVYMYLRICMYVCMHVYICIHPCMKPLIGILYNWVIEASKVKLPIIYLQLFIIYACISFSRNCYIVILVLMNRLQLQLHIKSYRTHWYEQLNCMYVWLDLLKFCKKHTPGI